MTNLIDIQIQIESLKRQAEAIRSKEFAATVADIRAKMIAFGITVKDIQTPPKKNLDKVKASRKVIGKLVGAKRGPKSGAKVEPKFKGPNGEVWSGRGITPKWLSALVAEGRNKDDFLLIANAGSVSTISQSSDS